MTSDPFNVLPLDVPLDLPPGEAGEVPPENLPVIDPSQDLVQSLLDLTTLVQQVVGKTSDVLTGLRTENTGLQQLASQAVGDRNQAIAERDQALVERDQALSSASAVDAGNQQTRDQLAALAGQLNQFLGQLG